MFLVPKNVVGFRLYIAPFATFSFRILTDINISNTVRVNVLDLW